MIDIGITFFFQLINFIVLYLILRHFLFEPITNFMSQRTEDISNQIESAKEKEAEAEKLKEKYQQQLKEAREEAQEIIENGRQRGKKRKEEIIDQAQEEANRKIEKAEDEIARAKQEAQEELRDDVANISAQMSKKVLAQYVTQQNLQTETIDQFIEQLDQDKLGEVR
ncbi:ATP synthase, F0 subunit b [Halobacteroides halobius DSM 5150]|uniref:ATP synthase subunit b n=1 Tax=Halobacteroides halobius (strain ATCC 35273 / DSM 5150 / MD-1) TaxID=748449 RepID=L0KBG7_HALHC|nr:F0F1 ATP synthase subunit B [Halobacteroides halobius]AGB42336.1 ATP synthase, F0 subunit b [Halobacteroides halobius DSM 5150]